MIRIRAQRGSLDESLETVETIQGTKKAIADYFHKQWGHLDSPIDESEIRVEYYCYDPRINWTTYIVLIDGNAVGFTDGPLEMDYSEVKERKA
jgi:hypothetical protein